MHTTICYICGTLHITVHVILQVTNVVRFLLQIQNKCQGQAAAACEVAGSRNFRLETSCRTATFALQLHSMQFTS
jgi:hypothetical protein